MKWQIFSLPLLLVTTGLLVFTNTSLAAPAEADDGLGRVFNTPQKRAILDQLRQRNARITPDQKVDTFALNGIVRRSSGAATVWVNGIAFHDNYPVAALGTRSARMFVGNGKTVELKVGEEINTALTGADVH